MVSKMVRELRRRLSFKERQISLQEKKADKSEKELERRKEKNEELKEEKRSLRKTLKKHADVYVLESKKALSTAILAAFAFLMALSWREYIIEVVDSILTYNPVQSKLISALVVTLIGVIGILLFTRLLSVKKT